MNSLIHRTRVCLRNKIIATYMYKEFRTNATSFSGSTQNDGYNMTQELLVRLGIPIIIWSCLVCYIKIQGNKDEIKAIKEMVQTILI